MLRLGWLSSMWPLFAETSPSADSERLLDAPRAFPELGQRLKRKTVPLTIYKTTCFPVVT